MKREDIALTVAGVLATMALAYWFYYQQQKAANSSQAQQTQDVMDPNYYTNQGLYDASMTYQYASQLPSLSVPTVSSTSSTSSQAANVDTSSSTAATGNAPTTDISSVLSQILADYHGENDEGLTQTTADFSNLVIPTIDTEPVISVTGIPVTASDAAANAQNMIANPPGYDVTNPPVASPVPVISSVGGLLDTSTAATPPPSTQAPSITIPAAQPILHNNHIMLADIANPN
jgi:hypothetical protein